MLGSIVIIGVLKVSDDKHLMRCMTEWILSKWIYGMRTAHDITCTATVTQKFHA